MESPFMGLGCGGYMSGVVANVCFSGIYVFQMYVVVLTFMFYYIGLVKTISSLYIRLHMLN